MYMHPTRSETLEEYREEFERPDADVILIPVIHRYHGGAIFTLKEDRCACEDKGDTQWCATNGSDAYHYSPDRPYRIAAVTLPLGTLREEYMNWFFTVDPKERADHPLTWLEK